MPIIFEGPPPYEPIFAKAPSSEPSLDGVIVTLIVDVDGLPQSSVPVRLVLEPEDARTLAGGLKVNSGVVEIWRRNQR
jgi:hypothetical protein